MSGFKLTVAYDGSRYNGWQRQGNTDNTIQGKIEAVLTELFGHKIEIHGSGRTDAGVHAAAQAASFAARTELSAGEICGYLNRYLPEDIAVTNVESVSERFHARLNAVGKTYIYRFWTEAYPNVFERRFMYHIGEKPDAEKMRAAAALLLGVHDFFGYSSLKKIKKSTVRTLESVEVDWLGGELRLTFKGDGFLYNSFRIMAGTLLEVGLGQRSVESVSLALETGRREDAGILLPAKGLTLLEVRFLRPPSEKNEKIRS